MTLLLDTHVVLWWLTDHPRLTPSMRAAIADPARDVLVSAVSAWEMSIKAGLGKLTMPGDFVDQLSDHGFDHLDVTIADGLAAGGLPHHHNDPFDRMLIAQAHRRDLVVVTADSRFADYDVRVQQ